MVFRLTTSTVLLALSLFTSHALVAAGPVVDVVRTHSLRALPGLTSSVTHISVDEATGELIGYDKDGAALGLLPADTLQARGASSGCRQMTEDEVRGLASWDAIQQNAKDNWGTGSYNLGTDYEGRTALVCVDEAAAVLQADAEPSCTTKSSQTGGTLVGTEGTVAISYTQGYTTTGSWTMTESTTLGAELTASVSFGIPDVFGGGASAMASSEVTNESSKTFTTEESSQDSQTITMNAEEGKTCHLKFTSQDCNVHGSGEIRYVASGYVWFNYNSKTHDHYRWAVILENVVPDVSQRSQSAVIKGTLSGKSTSQYEGECI